MKKAPIVVLDFNVKAEKKYGKLRNLNPMDENKNCMFQWKWFDQQDSQ